MKTAAAKKRKSIAFSPEQAMLMEVATKFCRDKSPIDMVRDQIETEQGFESSVWNDMVDAGWLAISAPEQYGGVGGGVTDLVAIAEPMGRQLFATPFASTQIVIQALSAGGTDEQCDQWLGRLCDGAIAAVAFNEPGGAWEFDQPRSVATIAGDTVSLDGEKALVTDAAVADVFLVSVIADGRPALALVEKSAFSKIERQVVVDETRRSYRVSLEGVETPLATMLSGDEADRAFAAIRTTALLLNAADSCGAAEGALQVALEYMKSRTQFGKLIGGYQGLKHPSVDVMCSIERARSHVYHAATLADDPDTEAEQLEIAVRMANAAATDAAAFAGDRAVQFHGGVGFTYECDAQMYLRRALWNQYQYGDAMHHRRRLADLLL